MKKLLALALLLLAPAFPAFASGDWDAFVERYQKQENIKVLGRKTIEELRRERPQGSESDLWAMLGSRDARTRAAAGVALVDEMFPDGNPGRWGEIRGFMPRGSALPRQLMAMDGLFAAVIALADLPDGIWAAAYLMGMFGESGLGKVKFIDEIPCELAKALPFIIEKTGLPGDWTIGKVRGRLPLRPRDGGCTTRDRADLRRMEYVDGGGSIASNGSYAWDRDSGIIYRVIDGSDRIIIFP